MTTTAAAPTPSPLAEPATLEELGLEYGSLIDLTLKTLFYRMRMTRTGLADELKLAGSAMQELLTRLTQDGLATVLGAETTGFSCYMYGLTEKGMDRAETALGRSHYVGPAPVTLADYVRQVRAQTVGDVTISRADVERGLGGLVLAGTTLGRIGVAASSRRATLIYGPSGNGKTTVVRTLGGVLGGSVHIPYAVEVVGQTINVYDPSKHERIEEEATEAAADGFMKARSDRRWVHVRRPRVWAGGELTRHSLELVYDDASKVYEAPLQLKANGGTLIIDDFGRQQMPAVQLLNRWIVALEGGVDHLTLHTGQTIEIPFDVLILFSTNLPPDRLADEAFLRRIRYKVEIPNPTQEEYLRIFEHECRSRGVPYDESAVRRLFSEWYEQHNRDMRGCHPRDLVDAIVDAARYDERSPAISIEALDEACRTYFLRPLNAPT